MWNLEPLSPLIIMISYFFPHIRTFRPFIYVVIRRGEQALEGIKEMHNIELSGSHSNFLFWSVFILAPWQAIYDFSSH